MLHSAALVFSSFLLLGIKCETEIWNDATFDSNLKKHGGAFVKFYAPWCGHCKRLAPTWEELGKKSTAKIVKVNCDDDGKETCEKFGVQGFPTLKYVKYNEEKHSVVDFSGSRDLNSLAAFAIKQSQPPFKVLKNDDIKSFTDQLYTTSFILFTSSANTKLFKEFVELANKKFEVAAFGVCHDKEAAKKIDVEMETVVSYKSLESRNKFEPTVVKTTTDEKSIEKFFESNLHGKVAIRSPVNDFTMKKPLLTVFINRVKDNDPSSFIMIRNRLLVFALKKDNMNFAVAQAGDFKSYLSDIGHNVDEKLEVIFSIDTKSAKYVPENSFAISDVKKLIAEVSVFLNKFENEMLTPHIKSEEIPEGPDAGEDVVKIVGKNFHDIVDGKKYVFIMFHASWCGHCKRLAPTWNQLAKAYKNDKEIVIAKIEATLNESPSQFKVTGFPTLYLVKPGQVDEPVAYEGARTVEAFKQFLKKHISSSDANDEL